jgi:hypothetical protein
MSRGGSRSGAGRPATHVKAEHCKSIDVRRWHRLGLLQEGRAGTWQWTNSETGKPVASIGFRSDGGSVTLNYSIDGRPLAQTLRLSQSACNYGGARPWFICPIRGERVAVLFLRAGRFACRHCQRISYASQSDDVCGRTWRKQAKAEAKLGPNWRRPKGMHDTTRERLLSIIWDCEERREEALAHFLSAFLVRHPSLRTDPLFRAAR